MGTEREREVTISMHSVKAPTADDGARVLAAMEADRKRHKDRALGLLLEQDDVTGRALRNIIELADLTAAINRSLGETQLTVHKLSVAVACLALALSAVVAWAVSL